MTDITWKIEFEGHQKPLSEVWGDEVALLLGDFKNRIEQALRSARDQGILSGIEVVFFVDDVSTWGVRFVGDAMAVQYAMDVTRPHLKP